MMASMIQAIQASKSSESSLASLRNLRTFLLLIEINMLGTNLETGSHIYPWLWSNQCRWFLTPKLYVQNHQIHQKKTVLQKRLLVQRWHPSASLRPNLTFLLRKNLPGEIGVFLILDISKLFCLPLHHVYPCWKNEDEHSWAFPCTFGWTWWCFTLPTDRGTWTQPEAFWIWTIDTRGLKPDCGQDRKVNSVVGFLK